MSLSKLFNRIFWHNNTTPDINEDNLNAMSKAIDDIDDRVIDLAGTIMEDVPAIQEDMEILGPAVESIDSNVSRAETAADNAEDSADEAEYWADKANPPIRVIKGYEQVITIDDAMPIAAIDVKAKVEPVQDLHGYGRPWAAGDGKNLFNPDSTNDQWVSQNGSISSRTGAKSVTINCAAGDILTLSNKNIATSDNILLIAYFDSQNNMLSRNVKASTDRYITGTAPTNSAYAICSFYTWSETDEQQLEKGSTATAYEPYANYCPISGYSEIKVARLEKNLFNKATVTQDKVINADGSITTNNYCNLSDYIAIGGNAFTVTIGNTADSVYIRAGFYDDSKNFLARIVSSALTSGGSYIFNAYPGAKYIRISYEYRGFTTSNDIQVVLGTQITPIKPYLGNISTIALDETRYVCNVDLNTGVMNVYARIADLGDLSYTASGRSDDGGYLYSAYPSGAKSNGSGISSAYEYMPYETVSARWKALQRGHFSIISNNRLMLCSTISDAATLKTAMTGQKIVYELTEPITVQLTPTEIELLQGNNILWADSGDIYLEYDASMIQRLTNQSISMDTFKAVVASSSDFADFKTKVAAL